ncbi:hypothetical protein [Rhizobium sp. MHM7A]|uniref:hypothetical protein n=1 Tax=Rhizobium sp. MHM7A TaxID=2583233 RepID=UPI00110635BE|nr:hypothetical protein [Rhizobium sp. MHM7A]TLX16433.1 hypothetical protein FFR93_03610 [Rhizobium sp. MHM7A]
MQIQVRDAVFETNSSSSHAAVISEQDILDQDFDQLELRAGKIVVEPRYFGYGSRPYRYNSPDGKLAYLLILAMGGRIHVDEFDFKDEKIDVLPFLLNHERVDYAELRGLVEFVRAETGCVLEFVMDFETADSIRMNDEVLNLTPMLEEKATLRRLLKSSKSWIDVGSDQSNAFSRFIDSDLGEVLRNPQAYVGRQLDQSFEIYFVDKRITYSDSAGTVINGVISLPDAVHFLQAQLYIDAHIVSLQVGRDEEAVSSLPKETEAEIKEAFHNLVHFIFEENARPDIREDVFNLTISNVIAPNLRGIRRAMSFEDPFFGEVGFRLKVECDNKTLESVGTRYEKKIVRHS